MGVDEEPIDFVEGPAAPADRPAGIPGLCVVPGFARIDTMKKLINNLAAKAGFRIIRSGNKYAEDGLITVHSDAFRRDPRFRSAYARGLKAALTAATDPLQRKSYLEWQGEFLPNIFGQWRTHIALWCARNASRQPGDFVECGVFVGFQSSAIMSDLDWDGLGRKFYLIDTFAGPDSSQLNADELRKGRREEIEKLKRSGGYRYDFQSVARNFSEWKNAILIQGTVPDVLPRCPAEKVAFLHLDMNCALPEIAAFRFFWEKIVPGGLVLLDDYAFAGFDAQHEAFDRLSMELKFPIASLPTGQGLIIKS